MLKGTLTMFYDDEDVRSLQKIVWTFETFWKNMDIPVYQGFLKKYQSAVTVTLQVL